MSERIGVLVMAYGGPRRMADVKAYLADVREGRPVSDGVLAEVERRYAQIGGGSPILEHTRAQAQALQRALEQIPGRFQVFVGMRHWRPFIREAVEGIVEAGIRRVIGLVMAPHYSRMSVGAYFDKVNQAIAELGVPLAVEGIESWKDCPGYLDAVVARMRRGLRRFAANGRGPVHLVFTAHSLPERIREWGDPYPGELLLTYDLLRARFPGHPAHFAYQSAAMTTEPWLGPDAGELMLGLMAEGASRFLVVPIGFVCEHVEILYDIDIEYRGMIEAAGGRLERIEMPGADPGMMAGLAALVRQAVEARGWL